MKHKGTTTVALLLLSLAFLGCKDPDKRAAEIIEARERAEAQGKMEAEIGALKSAAEATARKEAEAKAQQDAAIKADLAKAKEELNKAMQDANQAREEAKALAGTKTPAGTTAPAGTRASTGTKAPAGTKGPVVAKAKPDGSSLAKAKPSTNPGSRPSTGGGQAALAKAQADLVKATADAKRAKANAELREKAAADAEAAARRNRADANTARRLAELRAAADKANAAARNAQISAVLAAGLNRLLQDSLVQSKGTAKPGNTTKSVTGQSTAPGLAVVGSTGGKVEARDGSAAAIIVPAGSGKGSMPMSISTVPPPPGGVCAVACTPHGARFNPPVTVVFPLMVPGIPGTKFSLAFWNAKTQAYDPAPKPPIMATVSSINPNVAVAFVPHFSDLVLREATAPEVAVAEASGAWEYDGSHMTDVDILEYDSSQGGNPAQVVADAAVGDHPEGDEDNMPEGDAGDPAEREEEGMDEGDAEEAPEEDTGDAAEREEEGMDEGDAEEAPEEDTGDGAEEE